MNLFHRIRLVLAVALAAAGLTFVVHDVASATATGCTNYGVGTNYAGTLCNTYSGTRNYYRTRIQWRNLTTGAIVTNDGPLACPGSGTGSFRSMIGYKAIVVGPTQSPVAC